MVGLRGLRKCINPYTWSTQSLNSGLSAELVMLSPGCYGCHDSPSGPCRVPGTWTRVKWNRSMDTIQWFMLADGARSGLANMPLMYLVSTSTTKFRTPMRYIFRARRAWNRPYSSSFGCKKQDLWLFKVMEPKCVY